MSTNESKATPPPLSPMGEESNRLFTEMISIAREKQKEDREARAQFEKVVADLLAARAKDPVYHQVDGKAGSVRCATSLQEIVSDVAETDLEKTIHRMNDEVFVQHQIDVFKARKANLPVPAIQSTKGYDRLQSVLRANVYAPATSGAGAEWSPTGVSSSFVDYFRIATPLVQAIPSVDVGKNQILNLPVPSSKSSVSLLGALTGTTAFAPQGTGTINNPTTSVMTLVPKRLATDVLALDIMEIEDSPAPIVQMLTNEALAALADAHESCILNGDIATTGIDTTFGPAVANGYGTATTGVGIRAAALTPVTNTGDMSAANFSLTKFEANIKKLGHYGVSNDGSVVSVVNSKGWWDLVTDATVRSFLNFGDRATLIAGSLAKIYNSQVFVTNQLPDVQATSGKVTAASGMTAQSHVVFNRNRFRIGMKRSAEVLFLDPGLSQALQWRAMARHAIGYAPDASAAAGSWIAAVGTYTK